MTNSGCQSITDAFYAQYASTFGDAQAFDDIAHQIILIEQHTRGEKTGLLYHAWDESKQQPWANPITVGAFILASVESESQTQLHWEKT